MRVSYRWLKSYVDIDADVYEVANRLTMAGLEVESVEDRYPYLKKVITSKILEIRNHPKADLLKICKVTDGKKEYQIVCGAPNLKVNTIVPLALPGTTLPSGVSVQETTIRGEKSEGMLCSSKELNLGDDASGLWILPENTSLGLPLDKAIGIEDSIIDLSITPNRGDCLSVIGLARELSAIYEKPLKFPEIVLVEEGPPIETVARVDIEDPEKCFRYAARVIFDVKVGESPSWLKERLESAGIRAINNIVDVTNYVMLEMGQPLHAFDYERLADHRIVVKCLEKGTKFITLDGQERYLFDDSLMICDGKGPVAVAGIMGGEFSGIYEDTKHVLIESAFFNPISTRRTSRKLKLSTESSYRFERTVDPEGVITALDRATQLMYELAGGKIAKGRIDVYPVPFKRPSLELRVDKANKYLGTNLSSNEMASLLKRLFMDVKIREDGNLEVIPPSFRQDIKREVDLTEEIARIYGYDKIPVEKPIIQMADIEPNDHLRLRDELKNFMKGLGFKEIITYSFISQKAIEKLRFPKGDERLNPVRILNPLSEEQAVMRTTLVPSILMTASHNIGRQNVDLRLFELSKIFMTRRDRVLPDEIFYLVALIVGKREEKLLYKKSEVDYSDIKGVAEAVFEFLRIENPIYRPVNTTRFPYMDPASSASILVKEEEIGCVGELNPLVAESFDIKYPVWLLELNFEKLFELRKTDVRFNPLPKFPSVVRDLAVVVDKAFMVQDGIAFILSLGETLLEEVEILDIFESPQLGESLKSVTYRLTYRSYERSLTDEEVNEVHQRIAKTMTEHFGIKLR